MNKLRIVIVEDEPVTARNLAYLLTGIDDNVEIPATLSSVEEAVSWFKQPTAPYQLVFMDIRLADGLSFDIFKQVSIAVPVIFVTAYNDYAIQAFKNNGIDYVLKPFDDEEISRALTKFKNLTGQNTAGQPAHFDDLISQLSSSARSFKRSFLVHFRDKLVPVETARIAWFYTANEIVYAHTDDGKQYVVDFTMEQLESQLDDSQFLRANRQFIINRKAITEVEFYFNGRLLVKIKPEAPERVIISKARTPEFKAWMNR
jgi:DNA-binding LytR/AlgR family response regulator